MFLGIIGEYLGSIYRQVKCHPLTVAEQELNVPSGKNRISEQLVDHNGGIAVPLQVYHGLRLPCSRATN